MMVMSTSSTRTLALRFLLGLLNMALFPWLVFVLSFAPLQSLHWLRRRLCSQMPAPLQSTHWLRWRLCGHGIAPVAQSTSLY